MTRKDAMTQQVIRTNRDVLANLVYELYDETYGKGVTILDPIRLSHRELPLDAVFVFRELRLLCGERCSSEAELRDEEWALGPGDLFEMQSKLSKRQVGRHRELELLDIVKGVRRILTEARRKRANQLAARRDGEQNYATTSAYDTSQIFLATR